MRKNIFFLFFVFLFFMLFISLTYQLALPYAYYVLSLIMGILLIIMIYQSNGKKQWRLFLSIAMVFVFLRSVYLVASGFSLIPLSDGYADYAVAKMFLDNAPANVLSGYDPLVSGWPLLHILAASLSRVLNVDLLYVVLALPIIFSVLLLAFMYLLIREIVSRLGASHKIIPLALLIYAVSPDNIYSSMQFTRQNIGLLFGMTILYLLYRGVQMNVKDRRIELLFFIFSVALVLGHNLSPFLMLFFFSLFLIFAQKGSQYLTRVGWKVSFAPMRSISLVTIMSFSVMMFAWWIYYSPVVLTTYVPFLEYIMPSFYTTPLDLAKPRWSFYGVLRPDPYIDLFPVRDIAIYVSAAISFLVYLKGVISRKKLTASEQFLLYSVTALVAVFVVFEFLLNLQPLRVLWFAAPFLALFAAFFYDRLFSNRNAICRVGVVSLLCIVVFLSFLSPFARGYLPLYLYDPSIRFEDVGNHNPLYPNVGPFVIDHVQIENFEAILSDDSGPLYLLLPIESYPAIGHLYVFPEMINGTRVILFEFMHLNPPFHNVPYIYQEKGEVLDNLDSFKQQIMYKFNVVYDDGSSRILTSQDQSQT